MEYNEIDRIVELEKKVSKLENQVKELTQLLIEKLNTPTSK